MSSGRRSAGLPLSVGSASVPLRLLIALVFAAVGVITIAIGAYLAARGPLAAVLLAIVAVIPSGLIACVAAAFVVAPHSRFGTWLDQLVPSLNGRSGAIVAAMLWAIAVLIVLAAKSWGTRQAF